MFSPIVTPDSHKSNLPVWLAMIGVLLIHATLAVLRHSDQLIWDEGRYLNGAIHLLQGFFVDAANPDFVNGPGYPIVLMPFCSGSKGWLVARLLNAALMAGTVGFVWLTLRQYAGSVWAAIGALAVGLHPTLVWISFSLMTEPLAMFCLTGFMWAFCRAVRVGGWRWISAAAFFLVWLTLTRVFFGQVMMATAAMCLALLLIREWRQQIKRVLLVLAGAFFSARRISSTPGK